MGSLILGLVGLMVSEDASVILALVGGLVVQMAAIWVLHRRRTEPELELILEFRDIAYLVVGAVLQVALVILLAPLAEALLPDGGPTMDLTEELMDPGSSFALRATIAFLVVFVGPLVEELLYRGVLVNALLHKGETYVTWVTALVFSVVHVATLTPPYAATAALVLPPIFVLGVVLVRLRLRTGRLGPPIMTHMGFNAITAAVLLLPPDVLERLAG